ncbi:MAG: hypothetical protein AABX54_01675 [Nanoarchaeota archaeon]
MKKEKIIKTLKILSLFLIMGIMIILVVGVVRGEEEWATKFDGLSGETLTEAEAQGNPNAQALPESFSGKTEKGMYYDSGSNSVCPSSSCDVRMEENPEVTRYSKGSGILGFKGGGSEEEEGSDTVLKKADAALQAAIGLVQSIASIMGPLKEVLSNGQGQTTSNSQQSSTDLGLDSGAQAGFLNNQNQVDAAANGACDYQNREVCENVTTKNCENVTSSTNCTSSTREECRMQQVCVLKKDGAVPGQTIGSVLGAAGITGNAVAGSEGNNNKFVGVKLSQNNERGKADTSIREMGTLLASSVNLKAEVRGQMNVYTPMQKKTDITLKGSGGSPEAYKDSDPRYKSSASPVTGKVIGENTISGKAIAPMESGQFVKLVKHDLSIGGDEIGVETLKSLNELNANGADLNLKNGDTLIEFNKQKTYYSREIKETPYFINQITNQNDMENYFRLLHGGSDGNYLIDDSKRTTVGDITVAHPDATMKGIIIAKEREDMFKKGLMAKR